MIVSAELGEIEQQFTIVFTSHNLWFRFANQLELNFKNSDSSTSKLLSIERAKLDALRVHANLLLKKGNDKSLVIRALENFLSSRMNLLYRGRFLIHVEGLISNVDNDLESALAFSTRSLQSGR